MQAVPTPGASGRSPRRTARAASAGGAAALAALLALFPATRAAAQTSAPAATSAADLDLPVRDVTLPNGMRFLILRRPGAPTVSFVTEYRIGGVNEALGSTGLAHLLEHLMFKGTTTVGTRNLPAERRLFGTMDALEDSILTERGLPAPDTALIASDRERIRALEEEARTYTISNELDRILSENGAQNLNATTTSESTVYYVELPANRAQLWFVLEADRMENPVFREFYAERDVVMEERRTRVETNPAGRLYEEQMATAFHMHPYGVPVIGWMSDLRNHTREEAEAYYRRYYGPRNAVVAIVGDVDPDRMEKWAREYFGSLPPGESPPPVLAVEPPQKGERRVDVVFDASPALRVGWHVPALTDDDSPALMMLSSLLTGGRTARLYKRLVLDERLATYVSSSMGPGDLYPRLFSVEAYPRAPHTTAELEAAIYQELDSLAAHPPEEAELQRVRNQIEAGNVRRLQSNLGLAFQIADSETLFGDWRDTFRLSDRVNAVTAADVQRVAAKYFTAENRTVATLVKGPAGTATTTAAAPDSSAAGGPR